MKYIKTIILNLFITVSIFATPQKPDLLIYEKDTIKLFANPLESFFNKDNPRPESFFEYPCLSTACWRGYQAIWEIKDDKLYLNALLDCCSFNRFHLFNDSTFKLMSDSKIPLDVIKELESLKGKTIKEFHLDHEYKDIFWKNPVKKHLYKIKEITRLPKQKADLTEIFGELVQNNEVYAFWYTGDLIIPKGKQISYVHMGYMSKYEKELVLTIENGVLIDSNEYENNFSDINKGFGILNATSYSIVVPIELIPDKKDYYYTLTDTICYSNDLGTINLNAYSKFNKHRMESEKRKYLVEYTIDSLKSKYDKNYLFQNKFTFKLRWGTACLIDGESKVDDEKIRIFTMSNINTQVIIFYKEKEIYIKDFIKKADYILNSVVLMEFGY